MTYTIETLRTVNGKRYYIRSQGKLVRAGFASRTAARERIERMKYFEMLTEAQAQLKAQIRNLREECSA